METPIILSFVGAIVTLKGVTYHEGQSDQRELTILEIANNGTVRKLTLSDRASDKFLLGFKVGDLVEVDYEERIKDVTGYVNKDGEEVLHTVSGQAISAIRGANMEDYYINKVVTQRPEYATALAMMFQGKFAK